MASLNELTRERADQLSCHLIFALLQGTMKGHPVVQMIVCHVQKAKSYF